MTEPQIYNNIYNVDKETLKLKQKEAKKLFYLNRVKHNITDGKSNKQVYSDVKLPIGWWIGKTKIKSGMTGKRHSQETKNKMSKNMTGSKLIPQIPWNKGLNKETSSILRNMSEKLSISNKGKTYNRKSGVSHKYYNPETGEEKRTSKPLEFPWRIGSRILAVMTPHGITCTLLELKELCGLSEFLLKKKILESPNEWYYIHKKNKSI